MRKKLLFSVTRELISKTDCGLFMFEQHWSLAVTTTQSMVKWRSWERLIFVG